MSADRGYDVVVAGGGVIGLSVAWRLAQRGASVVVIDAGFAGRASWAAAGLLTPVTEAYWGEEALLALTVDSMRRWPSFAQELEAASGEEIGLELGGVVAVGLDGDDVAVIDDLHRLHVDHGLASERLRSSALRALEPTLAPQVRGGLLAPDDGAVDPRRVVTALHRAAVEAGAAVRLGHVARVVQAQGRVAGVEVDGGVVVGDTVVLAAGSWSGVMAGLPPECVPPVRPVYGEVIRLRERTPDHAPRRSIRAVVRGAHVYVVPRRTGEIVVGATSLERGFETRVTAGGVYELLRDARSVVPALDEAELVETIAGLRPGTPDNAPLIGWSHVDGLYLATGHYRNGILLTPVTADAVAGELVGGDTVPTVAEAAAPERFAVTGARR
jgi:glycine oxidase